MCDACGEEERAIDAALARYEASQAAWSPEEVWQRYLTAIKSIDALEARIAYLESWVHELLEERSLMAQRLKLRGDPDPDLRGSYPYFRRPGEPVNEE